MVFSRYTFFMFVLAVFLLQPTRGFSDGLDASALSDEMMRLLYPREDRHLENRAPLWDYVDFDMQKSLEKAVKGLGLQKFVDRRKLALALVDIKDLERPRVAAVNGDEMIYAASLPKIAILLGVFDQMAKEKRPLTPALEKQLTQMIRVSSNTSATAMLRRVGKKNLARILASNRYRLYNPQRNGGLWVGKDYGKSGLWHRDPIHNLSHGATTLQVARFYYLLEKGQLVSPEASRKMKEILSNPGIPHKFVSALRILHPEARLYRKSGSWRNFHSDSVIVERDGGRYIAVALMEHEKGSKWLQHLIVVMDQLIGGGAPMPFAFVDH